MNIQIFGTKKSNDSKKAERYFKERGIKFQGIDMNEKGLSKGEFTSVMSAVGGLDAIRILLTGTIITMYRPCMSAKKSSTKQIRPRITMRSRQM